MLPVEQPTWDSCLQACLASVLEWPLEAVPAVDHDCELWFDRYNADLQPAGLRLEIFVPMRFPGYWIAEVPSLVNAAPGTHVVVMHAGSLVWDPSTRKKYERVDPGAVLSTILMVPLDMAAWHPASTLTA